MVRHQCKNLVACSQMIVGSEGGVGDGIVNAVARGVGGMEGGENMKW